jgi:hypothetical protein
MLEFELVSFFPGKMKTEKLAIALGTSLGFCSLLLFSSALILWRRKKQRRQSVLGISGNNVHLISLFFFKKKNLFPSFVFLTKNGF